MMDLSSMVGKVVNVHKSGPEARTGKLLSIKPDHLVLHTTNEGCIYYKTFHIKYICGDVSGNYASDYEQSLVQPQQTMQQLEEEIKYLDVADFSELVNSLKYCRVKINRGGPASVEGILIDSNEEFLLLVVDKELVSVSSFHVNNISEVSGKGQKAQSQEQSDGNQSNQANTANQADSSKQGNKSKESNNNSKEKSNNSKEKSNNSKEKSNNSKEKSDKSKESNKFSKESKKSKYSERAKDGQSRTERRVKSTDKSEVKQSRKQVSRLRSVTMDASVDNSRNWGNTNVGPATRKA